MQKFWIPLFCAMLLIATPAFASASEYSADRYIHWNVDQAGKATNSSDHVLVDNICSVCGANVFTTDTGETCVSIHNEHGDQILFMTCDSEGNLIVHEKNEYTYDPDGFRATGKSYSFGKLQSVTVFRTIFNKHEIRNCPLTKTIYTGEFTRRIETYDLTGQLYSETLYNADGSLAHETPHQ